MQLSKELERNIEITCEICAKKLDNSQKILTCCLCNCKVHPKCNKKEIDNVNKIDNRYEYAFVLIAKKKYCHSRKILLLSQMRFQQQMITLICFSNPSMK